VEISVSVDFMKLAMHSLVYFVCVFAINFQVINHESNICICVAVFY